MEKVWTNGPVHIPTRVRVERTDQVSIRAPRAPLGPRRREGMGSVLDGVRVIDFGQYIAGPLAGMLLADQGADVIRVDPPGCHFNFARQRDSGETARAARNDRVSCEHGWG